MGIWLSVGRAMASHAQEHQIKSAYGGACLQSRHLEGEAGGSDIQGHFQLNSMFKGSLGYKILHVKKNQSKLNKRLVVTVAGFLVIKTLGSCSKMTVMFLVTRGPRGCIVVMRSSVTGRSGGRWRQ